jgi:hypothetical protein
MNTVCWTRELEYIALVVMLSIPINPGYLLLPRFGSWALRGMSIEELISCGIQKGCLYNSIICLERAALNKRYHHGPIRSFSRLQCFFSIVRASFNLFSST